MSENLEREASKGEVQKDNPPTSKNFSEQTARGLGKTAIDATKK